MLVRDRVEDNSMALDELFRGKMSADVSARVAYVGELFAVFRRKTKNLKIVDRDIHEERVDICLC